MGLLASAGFVAVAITLNPSSIGQGLLAVLVIVGYVLQHRSANKKADKIEGKADAIQINVDGRMTDALNEILAAKNRIEALERSLNIYPGSPAPPPPSQTP